MNDCLIVQRFDNVANDMVTMSDVNFPEDIVYERLTNRSTLPYLSSIEKYICMSSHMTYYFDILSILFHIMK